MTHKLNTLDKYVIFAFSAIFLFTIAEFVTSFWTGTHDTLTTCFFSTMGGEVLSCCLLKITKVRNEKKKDVEEGEISC